ncbi:hypothetical protein [Corynebacterium doosanense]|uniref:hypothetical protein n=1 Tax=Corynebacterium doosanense TaxID=1121358 RepID=UPI000A8A047C|nr:hypothetical protein [Corynebacterium doosanense]
MTNPLLCPSPHHSGAIREPRVLLCPCGRERDADALSARRGPVATRTAKEQR